jgi:hypothetical protein
MGILDVFIDIPRNIGNIMCCSARIDRDETTVGIEYRLWGIWYRVWDTGLSMQGVGHEICCIGFVCVLLCADRQGWGYLSEIPLLHHPSRTVVSRSSVYCVPYLCASPSP